MNRVNHKSLEWIHRIWKENYERTKDKSIPELLGKVRCAAEEFI